MIIYMNVLCYHQWPGYLSFATLATTPTICHQLHIGGNEHLTPSLFIDNWEVRKVDEQLTGVENLVDLNDDEVELDKSEEEKYLGDVINKDGKKTKKHVG